MSVAKSRGKIDGTRTKWDDAIDDAKRKIKALKMTILIYRQRKKDGDPWPSSQTQQH